MVDNFILINQENFETTKIFSYTYSSIPYKCVGVNLVHNVMARKMDNNSVKTRAEYCFHCTSQYYSLPIKQYYVEK